MLHQENSEAFVRHHSEQLDGRTNFLPEKYHIATGWNGTSCLVNASIAGKEVSVDHNKRPPSNGLLDMVDCKRLKQEDQTLSEKDYTADAHVNLPEYEAYRISETIFDSPAYKSEESENQGVDSHVHFSLAHTYVEDCIQSTSFYQREDIFTSGGLCSIRNTVPIGPNYQAELPDLSSPSCICDGRDESEKWVSNCVIPMSGSIESSSILKPVCCKADCNCVDEDSIECVRKHVSEARERLKGALGLNTFTELGFCDMGEDVALGWTENDEHLFHDVVSSNPTSLGSNFWDKLPLAFPFKNSKELVSYYFNVFMLRKRAEQNRFDPTNADSDNDEWQGSDDDQFTMMEKADEDLPLESLTDQDDGACNKVPLEVNVHEESSEEDAFDMVPGLPILSYMDHNQETVGFDTDAQDDSCTSFEAQPVGVADKMQTDISGDHYGNDGFGGASDHGFSGGHCDPKAWDIDLSSGWEKNEFLSTNNVIDEVFGSYGNGNDSSGGHSII